MVQGYYSLEEAARILGMSAEDLSQLAQRREVRAFADRGTWRFRTQDIEELARQRGRGSEPDLQFSDLPRSRQESPPPRKKGGDDVLLPLAPDESDQVEIGREALSSTGSKKGKGSGKGLSGKSPSPKPGSDSDVRLVAEGSDITFQIASDSDVKVVQDTGPKSGKKIAPEGKSDSGVRIVPMASDSDVKILPDRPEDSVVRLADEPGKTGTDSDIRLEPASGARKAGSLPPASDQGLEDSVLTEEIDLDAEMRRAEAASKAKKPKPKTQAPSGKSGSKLSDSSDFELTSTGGKKGAQPTKEEEVDLGAVEFGRPGGDSGINLRDPADSGISLEQPAGGDEVDFELSLDEGGTPKPAKAGPKSKPPTKGKAPAKKDSDSDSEFQLTLDETGLTPIDSDEKKPDSSDKDIFETDFEVPALEDDSGSEAVALDESDTDLESSDFELAIGDEDMVAEDESGSQVVALEDEEDADEGAATVAKKRRRTAAAAALIDQDSDEAVAELEEEEEARPRGRMAPVAVETSWGVMVPLVSAFTFLIIFVGGLMSYELLHGMWGYHQSQKVSAPVVDYLTNTVLPKEYQPPADK